MAATACRAYRYRFYPTVEQKRQLAKTLGCCRFVFNYFLQQRIEAWKNRKKHLAYGDCSALLPPLKEKYEWLAEISSVCLQQSLRHLDRAFRSFFEKRTRFPKFKSKHRRQSASYMGNAFTYRNCQITLAKQTVPLDIRWSRRFKETPTSLTVTIDSAGRYFVSIHMEETIQPLPRAKKSVGIDLGLTNVGTDSRGHAIAGPSFLARGMGRLKRLQRRFSRKKRGSKNSQKAKRQVARQHSRIRDRRIDFLHKVSRQLVNENQVIAAESLAVKKMLQAKQLSRSIADAAWSTLLRFLTYKCQWYGRTLVSVDQYFPSSKRCSHCSFEMDFSNIW